VRASVALLTGAVVLAGCGANQTGRGGPPPSSAESTFVQQCGACHTLSSAGTKGIIGTDFDKHPPTKQGVLDAIRTGPKNMPSDLVTGDEAQLVAGYVASHAGK
jgi:mono/diheme cytochrome c family protein